MVSFLQAFQAQTGSISEEEKKTLQLVSNIFAYSLLIALSHKSLAPELWLSFQHQVLHPWIPRKGLSFRFSTSGLWL